MPFGSFILGLVLVVSGLYSIVQKRVSLIIYNRGWKDRDYKPVFTLVLLTESRAVLYGVTSIIAALIVLIPPVLKYLSTDTTAIRDDSILFAGLIGLALAILGFVGAAFGELLNSIKLDAARKAQKKDK